MTKPVVTVNAKDVYAGLRRLARNASDANLGIALMAGALLIVNRAKELAPFDTGTLRRSITQSKWFKSGNQIAVRIGTNVIYAARLEFGYTGPDRLGRTFSQRPRPYLRPAFNEKLNEALNTVAKVLRKLLFV